MSEPIAISNTPGGALSITVSDTAGAGPLLRFMMRAKFADPREDIFLFNPDLNGLIAALLAKLEEATGRSWAYGELAPAQIDELWAFIDRHLQNNADWETRSREDLMRAAVFPWAEPETSSRPADKN